MRRKLTGTSGIRVIRLCARVVLWTCVSACGDEPAAVQHLSITLHAATPKAAPVAGTRFFANGTQLGITDESGLLTTGLVAREGDVIAITTNCPAGYRGPATPRSLHVHRYASRSAQPSQVLGLTAVCEPEERNAALVVRARRGAAPLSLAIRVDDELLGQTDSDGLSHMLLAVRPHRNVRVALDTSQAPQLRPRDPVRTFQIDDDQDVLVFDQVFSDAPRTRRTEPKRAARPHTPYRIR